MWGLHDNDPPEGTTLLRRSSHVQQIVPAFAMRERLGRFTLQSGAARVYSGRGDRTPVLRNHRTSLGHRTGKKGGAFAPRLLVNRYGRRDP